MDITEKILKKFPLVKETFFQKEGTINFLKIEVNIKDLNEITQYSKKINDFLDKQDDNIGQYYLDIYSSGTEVEIDKSNLQNHIGSNVVIKLNNAVKDKNFFEGELLENFKEDIVIRWNAKGQFRKQNIEKENILSINLSAKIKKQKKVKNEKRRV